MRTSYKLFIAIFFISTLINAQEFFTRAKIINGKTEKPVQGCYLLVYEDYFNSSGNGSTLLYQTATSGKDGILQLKLLKGDFPGYGSKTYNRIQIYGLPRSVYSCTFYIPNKYSKWFESVSQLWQVSIPINIVDENDQIIIEVNGSRGEFDR